VRRALAGISSVKVSPMQFLAAPARAASLRMHVVMAACSAVACLIALQRTARGEDAPAQKALTLPDVTVQQSPNETPPSAAPKPKVKSSPQMTAATKPHPVRAHKPVAPPIESAATAAAAAQSASLTSPARGNPGAPSSKVAGVPGASGAGAQAATGIDMTRFDSTPVFSATDILREVPGVSLKQGNGPRDIGISIRGSNARNGFGIRNIVILDDGFPVTQPDGLSRSDLIDPHAYAGVDVWRGPSSALFGNYATGGAINFRTWPGGVIDGVEYGIDVGSFNYLNNYVIGGSKGENWEASVFASDVRGDGFFGYSDFNTQTVNALITYQLSPTDKVTLKAINNDLDAELPFRLSLNQFKTNPFQQGCETAATAAAACATNTFQGVKQTAQEAGANRDDRRTIGGIRWEHEFDADTTGTVQLVIDDRNISQPTGTTSAVGDYLSYNVISGLTNRSSFAGLPTLAYLGAFWNYLPVDGKTYVVAPGGDAKLGPLQSEQIGSTMNFGARAREEVKLSDEVSVIAGATVERTNLEGTQYTYAANGSITGTTSVDRSITNIAPEVGVVYAPSREWQWRARVGTGYGTPQFSNLFINSQGQPGNNTDLQSQRNVGFDIGSDWTPAPGVALSLTGFYEFFRNELVSQSAGPGLMNYTFNAPASEHRGIEAQADVALGGGFRLTTSYIYNNQIYTDYTEQLTGVPPCSAPCVPPLSKLFAYDRSGNRIPGVSPNEVTTRLSYDVPSGGAKGLGAYVEYEWHDSFFMENANLLQAPSYGLVNLNVHYETQLSGGPAKSLLAYFEVKNVLDETYVASANNITDTVGGTAASLANVSGSIYAGTPRAYYGGMKVRF